MWTCRRTAPGAVLLAILVASVATAQYPVGIADLTLVDPDRQDRPVPVDLYYPATAAGPDAPVADPPPGGFATVAFGHGYQLPAGVYGWIAERLAGIGCVVALPRTASGLFPDHETFGLDLAFAARAIRDAGGDPDSPLFERMSPTTLVMGHSMGGGGSFLAAASDPSLTAVANFAAAETNPSAIAACAQLGQPALLFAGTNDCVTPPEDHQIPMYDALAGGWRTLVTITGASHCQFNAYSFLCALGEWCDADIGRAEQQDRVWWLLEPWVRAELLGDAAAGVAFQQRLEAADGFTYEQDGGATAAPATPAAPPVTVQVHPNPFNPTTTVRVTVAAGGPVDVAVHDLRGRRVRTLAAGHLASGVHELRWDGRDHGGQAVATGVYLVRVRGAGGLATARMALVR
jgi:pimeloyl-ACP methyl ester carboxylesterase